MEDRPFDLLVLGATGFTGQRVAAYLAKYAVPVYDLAFMYFSSADSMGV